LTAESFRREGNRPEKGAQLATKTEKRTSEKPTHNTAPLVSNFQHIEMDKVKEEQHIKRREKPIRLLGQNDKRIEQSPVYAELVYQLARCVPLFISFMNISTEDDLLLDSVVDSLRYPAIVRNRWAKCSFELT
jgi:hypothetical protein